MCPQVSLSGPVCAQDDLSGQLAACEHMITKLEHERQELKARLVSVQQNGAC